MYWHGVLVSLCSYGIENRGNILKNFVIVTNKKQVFVPMSAVLYMHRHSILRNLMESAIPFGLLGCFMAVSLCFSPLGAL